MGRKKKAVIIATLILLMLLSLSAVIYPVLSSWYTERSRSQVRTEYQEEIKQTDKTEIAAARAAALEYNRQLFTGKISPADDPNQTGYFGLLNLTGNGIMGYVEIPKLTLIYRFIIPSVNRFSPKARDICPRPACPSAASTPTPPFPPTPALHHPLCLQSWCNW